MEQKKLLVLLTTRNQQKSGTQTLTEWTGIFIQSTAGLNETEKRVFEAVQETLNVVSCGCVTGIPQHNFSWQEEELLEGYGLDTRFEM
jgi:hypothetical protein